MTGLVSYTLVLLWREFRKLHNFTTHINVIFRNNVLKWAKHGFGTVLLFTKTTKKYRNDYETTGTAQKYVCVVKGFCFFCPFLVVFCVKRFSNFV